MDRRGERKGGIFKLLQRWLTSEEMWIKVVGIQDSRGPSEKGIRRANRKLLLKLADMELGER